MVGTSTGKQAETQRYFENGTALHRVLHEAPYLPRCSTDKTAALVKPREYAINYPYMQVNRPGMVSWLIFDIDHPNSFIWDDVGLPAPNMIVRNKGRSGCHVYYAIDPVCTTENARSKPIAYMKAIYEAYAERLKADENFHSGPVAKTPGHEWWDTQEIHSTVYPLGKLADYVDLKRNPPWAKTPDFDAVGHSRHCTLFETLRFYAYKVVRAERKSGSFETFFERLYRHAEGLNSFKKLGFEADLPVSSIKATVRSVARWTWDRYTGGGGCNRGVMQLDPDLPLPERQRQAAQRTHGRRKAETESKIKQACAQLKKAGTSITQASVAKLAKLARQTVAVYQSLLDEAKAATKKMLVKDKATTSNGATSTVPVATASKVKFAVYQVSAALGAPVDNVSPTVFDG